ncbi:uncharacterized protein LOC113311543 [Papaver somniferum]|uniref:uncharacterized protein LOC113311543 n=1 Tax=Papaver somniferum TaxID=3469 RepID=UPI000E704A6E|nr:uncharacterized protein LOC113311543 [Papaver somniferum]
MGFCGSPFTWTSNKHGTGKHKSRLDRSLINNEWTLAYPDSILSHLSQNGSDHSLILLELSKQYRVTGKSWEFFEQWLQHDSCCDEIKSTWLSNYSGSHIFVMTNKVSNTRHILSVWSKSTFGNINNRILQLQSKISNLQVTDICGSNTEGVIKLEKYIRALNDIQASSNRQKARDHVYNDMDMNSKYFHIRANRRKSRNRIDSLLAPDGS